MKTIEVYETLDQSENDTPETKGKEPFPDAGGAHGSQNNNRKANGKEPLNKEQRQAAREVLEQAERRQVMDEVKINHLTQKFDTLSKPAQSRILEFSELSAEHQKLALESIKGNAETNTTSNDTPPKLPRQNDGSYQTLPPYTRMNTEELTDFVKENWGQFLKAFNSDLTTDAISRKELKSYDKRLMNRLEKLPAKELNNIIQTTSEKIGTNLIENPPTKAEIQRATQIMHFISRHGIDSLETEPV